MNNSAGFFIACVIAAFIVFITMRGELSHYVKAIFGVNLTALGPMVGVSIQ